MAFIYVITNKINGTQYVGKTTESIEDRWKKHLWDMNLKSYRPLYSNMIKYGIENFSIEQLEECSVEILSERELYWINKLNTYENGYNKTRGGEGKLLYNYEEIVKKYKELKNESQTAKFFKCSLSTVRRALRNYKVNIVSFEDVVKKVNGKKILMLPDNLEFDCLTDAGKFIFDKGKSKSIDAARVNISKVCRGLRKTAYGYQWEYINN